MNHNSSKKPNYNTNTQNQQNKWLEEWNNQWIIQHPTDEMLKFADKYSQIMNEQELTTSQIRNFFSEVVRIHEKGILNNKIAFLMLKPKLAYAHKRSGKRGTNLFKEIMTKAIDLVIDAPNDDEYKKRFQNFHALFEAILAYHKVHGGK